MLGLGCSQTSNVQSNPWSRTTINHGIHVLLVDHDKECQASTARLLELLSYKVTTVDQASTALKILQSGKKQYEVVIADIHSPDLFGYTLFQAAVQMDLLVILTSANEEPMLTNRALEQGAFLFIKKPMNLELMKYLWQHVVRDRYHKNNAQDKVEEMIEERNVGISINEGKGKEKIDEGNNIGGVENNASVTGKRKVRSGTMEPQMHQLAIDNDSNIKKKICTEWTKELHQKFLDAVNQLGEGKCYPKDILELMNVSGLTRMQVASHLQKCRHDNWRSPEDRRYHPRLHQPPKDNASEVAKDNISRKFGSMPRSCKYGQPGNQENPQGSAEINLVPGHNNNSANETGEGSRRIEVPQDMDQLEFVQMVNEDSTITTALDMISQDVYGLEAPVFDSTATTLMTSYADFSHSRQPSDDFLELTEDLDFLLEDNPEFHQGSPKNPGQPQG